VKPGSVVLLHGAVTGSGYEAECEILARRITVPPDPDQERTHAFTYEDCSVVGTPVDLPDGEYVARFEGYTLNVTLHRGLWLSRRPATPMDTLSVCG
jgi:hypothetical protein